jgi:hypothetical protein
LSKAQVAESSVSGTITATFTATFLVYFLTLLWLFYEEKLPTWPGGIDVSDVPIDSAAPVAEFLVLLTCVLLFSSLRYQKPSLLFACITAFGIVIVYFADTPAVVFNPFCFLLLV